MTLTGQQIDAPPDVPLADVKWRVDSEPSSRGTARFIPYLNAEIVAGLLDSWVGPGCWSDAYEPAPGKGLWCHLSIKVGDEWVTKTDIGVPSNMEAEKGQVSDAFKRAASLKWGVGRNVYRLPNVWAPVDAKQNRAGKNVAFPNAKTIPAIIDELKKQGFSDAAASEATSDHDDEAEPERVPVVERLSMTDPDAIDLSQQGQDGEVPDIDAMEKPDLVRALTDLGLPTAGPAPVLKARLRDHYGIGDPVPQGPADRAAGRDE